MESEMTKAIEMKFISELDFDAMRFKSSRRRKAIKQKLDFSGLIAT